VFGGSVLVFYLSFNVLVCLPLDTQLGFVKKSIELFKSSLPLINEVGTAPSSYIFLVSECNSRPFKIVCTGARYGDEV
jgi:hypothetical protein